MKRFIGIIAHRANPASYEAMRMVVVFGCSMALILASFLPL